MSRQGHETPVGKGPGRFSVAAEYDVVRNRRIYKIHPMVMIHSRTIIGR
jgi:hypothetical protein